MVSKPPRFIWIRAASETTLTEQFCESIDTRAEFNQFQAVKKKQQLSRRVRSEQQRRGKLCREEATGGKIVKAFGGCGAPIQGSILQSNYGQGRLPKQDQRQWVYRIYLFVGEWTWYLETEILYLSGGQVLYSTVTNKQGLYMEVL
ncbi:unnamed protein product [Caretta caretta]